MSDGEQFGDFRSACHDKDFTAAARCLHEMSEPNAIVAFDYAVRHFQGIGQMVWLCIESLVLLQEASIVSPMSDDHNAPSREHIFALIKDEGLRTLLLELERYSMRGWTASFGEEQRSFLFGLDAVSMGLEGLLPSTISRVIDRAAKPAPVEPLRWMQRDEEKLPSGLLPLVGVTSRSISGEIWWLVCNGEGAGRLSSARYAYGHTIADGESIAWQELVARIFLFLLAQERHEVLVSDPNREVRRALWEDLVDLNRDVALFRE